MNFTQLRAFHAVASEGGFTRGARRIGISQPAVTVQVRALEQRYGIALFRRLGQRIELTEFGRELWQRTRRAFAQIDDLEELLASAGELRVGRLEIGADGPFAVMDLVAAFIGRYPGVRIAVRIGNAARVLADLREARTDLAVLNLIEPDAALHSEALSEDRIVAFVTRGHPLARRRRLELAELAAAPLILREPGSAPTSCSSSARARRCARRCSPGSALARCSPRSWCSIRVYALLTSRAPACAPRCRSPACPNGASCARCRPFSRSLRSLTQISYRSGGIDGRGPIGGSLPVARAAQAATG